MAPKKSSAGGKKRKTAASTPQSSAYDATKFIGPEQAQRFTDLEKRTVWPERIFDIMESGIFGRFVGIIDHYKWGKLINPPKKINFELAQHLTKQPHIRCHHAATQPPAFATTDPNFQNFVNYICDQNDAGFRAMTVVHESIFRSQSGQTVMTPPEFLAYVDWPGARPTFSGGGGAGDDAGVDAGGDAEGDAGDDVENAASDASMEEGDGSDDAASD
ncbi:hypothetical protein P8452_18047 [Trifolium repens]|nr:hypothetical protein P8452_18047 [Trifolium repens]